MQLPEPFSEDGYVNVIIETPSGSRNKFRYNPQYGLYELGNTLPSGLAFPCDMGFFPHTKGEDGDPLDALVLMEKPTFPGCLVQCRLLGVIKIAQTEKRKTIRNDRFVCVPVKMKEHDHLENLKDVNSDRIESIIEFFKVYNKKENKLLEPLGFADRKAAEKLIRQQMQDNGNARKHIR